MLARLEINPPKVADAGGLVRKNIAEAASTLEGRVRMAAAACRGVHLTDSVLGIPRLSPITLGARIKESVGGLEITASLRTRDRSITGIIQAASDALAAGLDGMLLLSGDPGPERGYSGIRPSAAVSRLNEMGFGEKLDLYLSLPSRPDFAKIRRKTEAGPAGFITQVVHGPEEVARITDELVPQGFRIIPIVLAPSPKNSKAAGFLGIDWSGYEKEPAEFVRQVLEISRDAIITSPGDFGAAVSLLESVRGQSNGRRDGV